MATTTTNFGWDIPQSTDLVKDGATAIAALGQDIDTALVDLKGGTTGQVLAKASATDLDYSWVTTDDTNAIQNAIVDAKGDLIAASAADVPARLAVGNNGETLVADSSTATGLSWQPNFAAGKNNVINGDFGIWQRGTSITATSGQYTYGPDRFSVYGYGVGTGTVTQQTFTPGTAPVAGYEGQFFARFKSTNTNLRVQQPIEDVRTFAGQTATVSFWMKSPTGTTADVFYSQNFGSGGSASVDIGGSTITISSSWARYTHTVAIPSVAGKTIGTSSYLALRFGAALNVDIDIWGVQFEKGSAASPFQTATGTEQGELAACQRYYQKSFPQATAPAQNAGKTGVVYFAQVVAGAVNQTVGGVRLTIIMRTTPTVTTFNPDAASAQVRNVSAGTNWTATAVEQIGDAGFGLQATAAAGSGAGDRAVVHYTAEAEL